VQRFRNKYFDKLTTNEIFTNPLSQYSTMKPYLFFKAFSNKCIGYMSTIDFIITIPIFDDRRLRIETT